MSTSAIEVSGEKVKAMWDKRLTEIFCDICIKELLEGNRREWKAWKKLKGEDTGLGWNPIKRTVDASDDWWESRLKVVPKAQKFRTSGIDPEFEGKLDQMFMGIVATGDKAWAPSSGTLRSDIFEVVNNEIPEENEEKMKNPEISSSHFKTGRKKSSKQIGGAARLSSQIEKLCNAADNMSQATSSLTHVMDPYGIPQAVKVLDSMSEEVPEASLLYFFALRLLLNKDKRIMFLSINPKIRALWLKREMEDS
ncbi:L10-interacting MYB domain-containing protein-like [Gossypium hirsutum]|uniref:L10-interacting MYB domain-containing protein-like n=1 Tax=Gossypium hirsutum TaxID=3635 RepID=A0ABM3BJ68_GOSHI|nr:L10-interacting MYB domain-containing protein-like [Gossypium hirsutum]